MIISPGIEILETIIIKKLWVVSLASACGLNSKQAEGLIFGRVPIIPAIARLLPKAVGRTPEYWLEAYQKCDQAILAGETIHYATKIPRELWSDHLTTWDNTPMADAEYCKSTGNLDSALNWWLKKHQVFNMLALSESLEPLTEALPPEQKFKTGGKTLAIHLHRRGFRCHQERWGKQVLRVWRFNPHDLPVVV